MRLGSNSLEGSGGTPREVAVLSQVMSYTDRQFVLSLVKGEDRGLGRESNCSIVSYRRRYSGKV